jgi:hypothetical protein
MNICEHTKVTDRKQHAKKNLPYNSFRKNAGRKAEKQSKKTKQNKKIITNV